MEQMESRRLLATFFVTNTADSGPGTLRQAMLDANGSAGPDNIEFEIPASTSPLLDVPVAGFNPISQVWTITLASPLPVITDQVTIDGFSQAHFPVPFRYPQQLVPTLQDPKLIQSTANQIPARDGNNAKVRLIIDGSGVGGTGFEFQTSHSMIRGLAIDGFDVGVSVPSPGFVGNVIQGNFIGQYFLYLVDPQTGDPLTSSNAVIFTGLGNTAQGVILGSTNATVGGAAAQENNVIVGNAAEGVWIQAGGEGNQVLGNQIGIAGPTDAGRFAIAPNGAEGVLVESSSNAIGGAVGGAGNLISGNASHGVWIRGVQATRNRVDGNYIGVPPGGAYLFGASDPGNQGDGIRIENAPANRVGGAEDILRNSIGANNGVGVRILGPQSTGNVVTNNFIGLIANGAAALGNAEDGVRIAGGASRNQINGGNVISSNLRGVYIVGATTTLNVVSDNFIGTDLTGEADLGNAREGVRIEDSPNNQVTGNGAGSQLVSGNDVGVAIVGPGATGNAILGNLIGTNVTGMLDLNNSQQGVLIDGAPNNIVGGATAATRNLISANHWGVELRGPQTTGNVVQGNFIGTDITGNAPLGNGSELDGVLIRLGASRNTIGGTSPAAGNRIAFNERDGVRVEDNSVGNAILTNAIFSNTRLGIDLFVPGDPPSGVTPNDPGDADTGPNNLQNHPIVTSVATSPDFTNIQGSLSSAPNQTFLIQLFANTALDPSGSGEGERFLGETQVVTDGSGFAVFNVNVPSTVSAGQFVTATATSASGDTSEFSPGVTELLGTVQFSMTGFTVSEGAGVATISVTRTGGSGGFATVEFATANGTAIAGVDYLPASGTLTFEAGVNVQTFNVTILDNSSPEAGETVLLSLSDAVGAATIGSPSAAVLTIQDDDQPGLISFSSATYTASEDGDAAVITVVRDSGGGTVSIDFATSDGTAIAGVDYVATAGTLVFNPGQTLRTFSVTLLAGAMTGDRTVNLALSNPTGGAGLGTPSTAILVISDVNAPRIINVQAVRQPRAIGTIVLTFDQLLNPVTARDLRNYGYSVQTPGRDRQIGTRDDILIGIRRAIYNPDTRTVRLRLERQIHRNVAIRVRVNQVTDVPGAGVGVSSVTGVLLDGNGNGRPGGVFDAVINTASGQPAARPAKTPRGPRMAMRGS
jgi:hypothetical protein